MRPDRTINDSTSVSEPATTAVSAAAFGHSIADTHPFRCFIMPGRARTIQACCASLVYYTTLVRSLDAGYSVKRGDVGFLYDTGARELIGVFEARSAPKLQPLPPDYRMERGGRGTKNALAIPLQRKETKIVPVGEELMSSIGLIPEATHTGEVYYPNPVLEGDAAQVLLALFGLADSGIVYPDPESKVAIISGDLKGMYAIVKSIDRAEKMITIELCGVVNPIPLRLPRDAVVFKE